MFWFEMKNSFFHKIKTQKLSNYIMKHRLNKEHDLLKHHQNRNGHMLTTNTQIYLHI